MTDAMLAERASAASDHDGPVVLVNTFHAKPGKLDEFIEVQMLEVHRLAATAAASGWRGSRLHRSLDGRTAVVVAVFESRAAQSAWAARSEFADHVERITPLLERIETQTCSLVFEAGRI